MDVINTENLYESFVRKYSIGTNSRKRFAESFLSAFNDALMDTYNDGHIDEPSLLTSTNDDCDLEINYLPVIKTGIMYYLQSEGEWVKGESRDQYAYLNWETAKTRFLEVATKASEDDETSTYPWSD